MCLPKVEIVRELSLIFLFFLLLGFGIFRVDDLEVGRNIEQFLITDLQRQERALVEFIIVLIAVARANERQVVVADDETMPEFEFRLKVKAGLTGYAQVTGVYDTTPYDKLKMDLMYIENYSVRMDLQIIIMTLKTMLLPGKTNAETEEGILPPVLMQKEKEENNK